ncbi:MAG: TetR/AcrR family transcriptional regulator [Pseudomonadota bacterium]
MSPAAESDVKTQRILNAVRAVLARNGYARTTINLVAAEAGVSRGLLHYYFASKEDMLVRVIQENMDVSVRMIGDIFQRADTVDHIADGLTAALRSVLTADPDFFNLFFEAWSVARLSPAVDARLREHYDDFRSAVRAGLETALQRGIISPALSLVGMAALLTGIIDGYGLQMVTEPRLIDEAEIWDAAGQAIRMLLGDGATH